MSDGKTYRIKGLEWAQSTAWAQIVVAIVPDGQYEVWQGAGGWFWAYPCALLGILTDTETAAKLAAERHWCERIGMALEEVKP